MYYCNKTTGNRFKMNTTYYNNAFEEVKRVFSSSKKDRSAFISAKRSIEEIFSDALYDKEIMKGWSMDFVYTLYVEAIKWIDFYRDDVYKNGNF